MLCELAEISGKELHHWNLGCDWRLFISTERDDLVFEFEPYMNMYIQPFKRILEFGEIFVNYLYFVFEILAIEVCTFSTKSELEANFRGDVIDAYWQKLCVVFLENVYPNLCS